MTAALLVAVLTAWFLAAGVLALTVCKSICWARGSDEELLAAAPVAARAAVELPTPRPAGQEGTFVGEASTASGRLVEP
jgi:hypothetical protein